MAILFSILFSCKLNHCGKFFNKRIVISVKTYGFKTNIALAIHNKFCRDAAYFKIRYYIIFRIKQYMKIIPFLVIKSLAFCNLLSTFSQVSTNKNFTFGLPLYLSWAFSFLALMQYKARTMLPKNPLLLLFL